MFKNSGSGSIENKGTLDAISREEPGSTVGKSTLDAVLRVV
jgi:hypothetical protein